MSTGPLTGPLWYQGAVLLFTALWIGAALSVVKWVVVDQPPSEPLPFTASDVPYFAAEPDDEEVSE